MIELLVVIVIIGIVSAALMAPRLGAQPGLELRAAARALADALSRTRDRAVISGRSALLAIDVDRRQFRAEGDRQATDLPDGAAMTLRTVKGEVADRSRAGIRFFADGGSTGGGVVLSGAGSEYRIGVDWLTGRVEVSDGR